MKKKIKSIIALSTLLLLTTCLQGCFGAGWYGKVNGKYVENGSHYLRMVNYEGAGGSCVTPVPFVCRIDADQWDVISIGDKITCPTDEGMLSSDGTPITDWQQFSARCF